MSFIQSPFGLTVLMILGLTMFGAPIGLSMIGASIFYLFFVGQDIGIAAEQLLQGIYNSYTLLSVPLFIIAANFMSLGAMSDKLMAFCNALVGRFRGGMGHVNVISSLIFAGMSGSAVADAVGIGKLTIEMMVKDGRYTPSYAAAITAATAVIGPIIPPSIPMVLFALVSDASIGYLFLAGVIPGILMALVMSIVNWRMAIKHNFPVEAPVPIRELPRITWESLPALMMPVVLLGGIYGGVMTPTEAAAVAASYALVISWVLYRSVTLRATYASLISSARNTASVGILIAGALVFNYVVTIENIPVDIKLWLDGFHLNMWQFLLMVNLLLLVLGCLLDASTVLLVIVPILIPTAQALGIDMVHFGVVVVVNLMIGLITPPYGLLLFIVANITRAPFSAIVKDTMPFIYALIASLAIITAFPDCILWLPRLLGYKG
jgi:tripartite ATP-independent transporter DctM subunit